MSKYINSDCLWECIKLMRDSMNICKSPLFAYCLITKALHYQPFGNYNRVIGREGYTYEQLDMGDRGGWAGRKKTRKLFSGHWTRNLSWESHSIWNATATQGNMTCLASQYITKSISVSLFPQTWTKKPAQLGENALNQSQYFPRCE